MLDPEIPAPTTFKLPLIAVEPVIKRLPEIIVEPVIFVIPVMIFDPDSIVLPLTDKLLLILNDPVTLCLSVVRLPIVTPVLVTISSFTLEGATVNDPVMITFWFS